MSEFEPAVEYLLRNEGGLSLNLHGHDPGSITNFGISLRFLQSLEQEKLRKYGIFNQPDGDTVRHMPVSQAVKIYHDEWWDHYPIYRITSQDLANQLFDAIVNLGAMAAVKCLQRALWSFYHGQTSTVDDGILNGHLVDLINYSPDHILPAFRSERAGHYRLLAAENPNLKDFLTGWLKRAYGK